MQLRPIVWGRRGRLRAPRPWQQTCILSPQYTHADRRIHQIVLHPVDVSSSLWQASRRRLRLMASHSYSQLAKKEAEEISNVTRSRQSGVRRETFTDWRMLHWTGPILIKWIFGLSPLLRLSISRLPSVCLGCFGLVRRLFDCWHIRIPHFWGGIGCRLLHFISVDSLTVYNITSASGVADPDKSPRAGCLEVASIILCTLHSLSVIFCRSSLCGELSCAFVSMDTRSGSGEP